jgi:hypothetical protein
VRFWLKSCTNFLMREKHWKTIWIITVEIKYCSFSIKFFRILNLYFLLLEMHLWLQAWFKLDCEIRWFIANNWPVPLALLFKLLSWSKDEKPTFADSIFSNKTKRYWFRRFFEFLKMLFILKLRVIMMKCIRHASVNCLQNFQKWELIKCVNS